MNRSYWGYRIDTSSIEYFAKELEKCTLRQGWGYDKRQDLRKFTLDEGAKRNFVIKERVKKGDILLIPRLPEWGLVAIVEATDNFDNGYSFEIDPKIGDYGHCFPAKKIGEFSRTNKFVSGDLRSTLKARCRFWNLDYHKKNIEELIKQINNGIDLTESINTEDNLTNTVQKHINKALNKDFEKKLINDLNKKFESEKWEKVIVEGLKKMYPNYKITKIAGGQKENKHGTDILIEIPGLTGNIDDQYLIAIQVKDHYGQVNKQANFEQIEKSEHHLTDYFEGKLIEKWIIYTNATKEENEKSDQYENENIKVLYKEDFNKLLIKMAKRIAGINLEENN